MQKWSSSLQLKICNHESRNQQHMYFEMDLVACTAVEERFSFMIITWFSGMKAMHLEVIETKKKFFYISSSFQRNMDTAKKWI